MDQATKNKIRDAMLGKKHSEATKQLLREKMTGKKLSPEAVQKMKVALKDSWDKKLQRGKYAPKVKKVRAK